MANLAQHLIELSDKLDKSGKTKCADAVDNLTKTASLDKVAQYVGVIGYVLRQNRAMGNCIRKKRVASNSPMQEVVLECLKEYQDGNQYNDTEWASKYAQVVQQVPEKFGTAHLSFLSILSQDNDMSTHVENVRNVTAMLEENEAEDDLLNQVLGHINALQDLLQKEGDADHRPFKVAAPKSPRKWWERIFTPSRGDWWNIFGSGRGEDEDTRREMSSVLENLRGITLLSQRMKTNISRLQNQIVGYLTPVPNEHPPLKENQSNIDAIVSKINEIDLNNWGKAILNVQQLQYLLEHTNLNNPNNEASFEQAKSISEDLHNSIGNVYEHITEIQENMYKLRQREAVRGRSVGQSDPMALSSPANEFGQLEQVLRKLYRNPFDDKALYYAERMHSILDDKLRSVVSTNNDAQEYLQSINQPDPVQPQPDQPEEQSAPTESVDLNNPALRAVSDALAQQGNVQDIVNVLTSIYDASRNIGDPSVQSGITTLKAIRDLLLESPTYEESNPFQTTPAPGPEAAQPVAGETPVNEPDHHQQAIDGFIQETGQTPAEFLDQMSGKRRRSNQADVKRTIIRIADALDRSFPEIADLLDQYLEEHEMNKEKLPEMPAFSAVIKETVVNTN